MTDDRAVGEAERLHPLFLLTGLGGSLRGLAGLYAFIAYLILSGQTSMALLVAVGSVAVSVVGVILYWKRFVFRVGATEIRIDSGIISRTNRSIPFDRVQDVDISQGPVARLFGLAKVKLETGASAGAKQDEGVLRAITLERAEELRELIKAHRAGATAIAAPTTDADRLPIFAMNAKRLLLAGLFNFSLAVFAGLFGVSQTFGDVAGFDPLDDMFWRNLLAASAPLQDFVLGHRLIAVTAGLLLLILLGAATGIVRTLLRDYGFRLERTETGLRRRRGLLTKTDVTLPVSRVQAAIVASGPIRAAFGWSELKLQSLAADEGGKGDHVVAPLAREAEVTTIVGEMGWRQLDPAIAWQRVSLAYVWTLAIGLSPLFLVAILQVALFGFAALALRAAFAAEEMPDLTIAFAVSLGFLLVLAGAILFRWLAWRRTGYALEADRLLIRTGWWRRRRLVLPIGKIQSFDFTQSFVSRRFGIATLRFGVAGGGGFSAHLIPAIPTPRARQLRDELLRLTA